MLDHYHPLSSEQLARYFCEFAQKLKLKDCEPVWEKAVHYLKLSLSKMEEVPEFIHEAHFSYRSQRLLWNLVWVLHRYAEDKAFIRQIYHSTMKHVVYDEEGNLLQPDIQGAIALLKEARQQCKRLLDRDPDDLRAAGLMSEVLVVLGNLMETSEVFEGEGEKTWEDIFRENERMHKRCLETPDSSLEPADKHQNHENSLGVSYLRWAQKTVNSDGCESDRARELFAKAEELFVR